MYKPAPDRVFTPDKYNDPDKKLKLSADFEYLSHWMPQHSKQALKIAMIIKNSGAPHVAISNTKTAADALNICIHQCNKALAAPLTNPMRTEWRLRTAIRRISEFVTVLKDPFNCQSNIKIADIGAEHAPSKTKQALIYK